MEQTFAAWNVRGFLCPSDPTCMNHGESVPQLANPELTNPKDPTFAFIQTTRPAWFVQAVTLLLSISATTSRSLG